MARKQTEIPGTERFVVEEVSDAADRLHDLRCKALEISQEVKTAKVELIDVMKRNGFEQYVDEDLELRVVLKQRDETVSVTKIKPRVEEDESAAEAAE